MKTSRIDHPEGSRFFMLYRWAIESVGKAAAAVLSEIEFLDRVAPRAGTPVATRARIVAELEGFIGRNSIDDALGSLVDKGWLVRHERIEGGPTNLVRRVEFSLDAKKIKEFLAEKSEIPK